RDLVKRILAEEKNPKRFIASDIMTKPVVSVLEDTSISDAIDLMKENNIRRVVILNNNNNISGILTIDDIGYNIERYAEEIGIEYFLLSRKIRERKS
ncbi:MAG: CBS domain-containing protein, partial [Candidatus Thorarchaeota archaeon]